MSCNNIIYFGPYLILMETDIHVEEAMVAALTSEEFYFHHLMSWSKQW